MVIVYDKNTKEVIYTEFNALIPTIGTETDITAIEEVLGKYNQAFVSVPQDIEVLNMKVCFDTNNNFIGLQPK